MIKNNSQAGKILEYMMMIPGRKITKWEAYKKWNITTLSQRIADLRVEINEHTPFLLNKVKYIIKDELTTEGGKTFSRYWLEPLPVEVKEFELELKINHDFD
jgi:hypothetical protein